MVEPWPKRWRNLIFESYFPLKDPKIELEEVIGRGRFGKVYKAKDTNGEMRAVKCLSKCDLLSEGISDQICEEMRMLSLCGHHPHIVQVLQTWQDEFKLYLAMPLYSRGTLYSVWREQKEPFSHDQIYVVLVQMCMGLDFLHHAGN